MKKSELLHMIGVLLCIASIIILVLPTAKEITLYGETLDVSVETGFYSEEATGALESSDGHPDATADPVADQPTTADTVADQPTTTDTVADQPTTADPTTTDPTTDRRDDGLPRPTVEQGETDFTITPSASITTATSRYPNCDTPDLTVEGYTISACNIGATTAGTGETSYGSLFQRGNNYGFPSTGTITTGSTLVNASSY
jgi:hypothetical protein